MKTVKTIPEIEEDMKVLIEQIEGEDAIEEVAVEYKPYKSNMEALLSSTCMETYLEKYDEICQEDTATLECFNVSDLENLKAYIEENEIDFDTLKTETVNATCEALKFLIYEAEDEEY